MEIQLALRMSHVTLMTRQLMDRMVVGLIVKKRVDSGLIVKGLGGVTRTSGCSPQGLPPDDNHVRAGTRCETYPELYRQAMDKAAGSSESVVLRDESLAWDELSIVAELEAIVSLTAAVRSQTRRGVHMTAEIAILNRAAIALAADSAVTLAADLKVYKTANKIFPLSLDPPIVIMFYGAGSLGSIPWETVVQEYKRTHPSLGFATVEESGAHFIGFLPDMTKHISRRIQLEFVRTEIVWELEQLSRFAQANLASHVRTQPSTPAENLDYFLLQVREGMRARLNFLAELGPMDGLTDRVATRQFESALRNWELLGTRVDDWNRSARSLVQSTSGADDAWSWVSDRRHPTGSKGYGDIVSANSRLVA